MRKLIAAFVCCLLPALARAQGATAPAEHLAIPDAKELGRAKALVHTLFKEQFADGGLAGQQALGKKLLAEAGATMDDNAARYDLLLESAEIAAGCVDLDTAMKAGHELARLYAVEGRDLERQTLERAKAAARMPQDFEAVAGLAIILAEQAAQEDEVEAALKFAGVAESASLRSQKVAFSAGLQTRIAGVRDLAREFAAVKGALEVLNGSPKDEAAHLTVGQYYALHKGQFAIGLPHLAAGNDRALRDLAFLELSNPSDPQKQLALADAWWDYSQKASGATRLMTAQHARQWYVAAKAGLTGITLTRIQARLQADTPATATAASVNAGAGNGANLLAMVDPVKDGSQGQWSVDHAGLTCTNSRYASLALPYLLPDEYDLRVSFTRVEGNGPVCVLLASGKKTFGFEIDVKGEARFERVAGKIAKDNPTTVAATLSNNHAYTLTIQIRRDSIAALLDGKLLTQYKTDFKDLSRYALWKLPDEKLCGVGANNAKVAFQSIEIVTITGTGKPLR